MISLDDATYKDIRPSHIFKLEPKKTALIIVDVQYSNCSREHGMGKRLKEQSPQDVRQAGFEPSALLYRYDCIEKTVLPCLQKLLNCFRQNKLKVVHVTVGSQRQDFSDVSLNIRNAMEWANNRKGCREHNILDEVRPKAGEYVVNKTTSGAFASSGIDNLLRTLRVEYLVVCGVTTEFCPGTTAREAAERGYHVVMVDDCCASLVENWHRIWMVQFQMFFGRVSTADGIISELEASLRKRGK